MNSSKFKLGYFFIFFSLPFLFKGYNEITHIFPTSLRGPAYGYFLSIIGFLTLLVGLLILYTTHNKQKIKKTLSIVSVGLIIAIVYPLPNMIITKFELSEIATGDMLIINDNVLKKTEYYPFETKKDKLFSRVFYRLIKVENIDDKIVTMSYSGFATNNMPKVRNWYSKKKYKEFDFFSKKKIVVPLEDLGKIGVIEVFKIKSKRI
jgi:hypothetical protein